MAGNTLTPEQAYRFARGEEVVSSTGVPVKLSGRSTFSSLRITPRVSGSCSRCRRAIPRSSSDPLAAQWSKVLKTGTPEEKAAARARWTKAAGHGHPARAVQGPEGRGAHHEVGVAGVTATAEKFNEPGALHRDDRLRVDLGARREQPAPQRPLPRRQGQGGPGLPVQRLEQRGPREALGVDGGVREEDGRAADRHPPQRQPLERPDVRTRGF